MGFWAAALSLFLVINALGNIPLFVGLLGHFKPKRQRYIIFREMIMGLIILLLFGFFGKTILNMLQISQSTLEMAGGVLLFLVALRMIFPSEAKVDEVKIEPFVVPLAVPTVAGPGAIATCIIIQHTFGNPWLTTSAILIAWGVSFIILMAASNIKHVIGDKGLIGFERFGGMLVILIGVHMIAEGIVELVKANFP